MIYRKLGPSGIDVSAVAFGAWAIGGWMWGGADENQAVDAIHAALDHGITLIDTAPDLRLRPLRGVGRPGDPGPPRQGRPGHQVRHGLGPRGGRFLLPRQPGRRHAPPLGEESLQVPPAREHPRGAGAEPQAAGNHLRRSLPDALAGIDHAHRRDDGDAGEAQGGGENPAPSASATPAWCSWPSTARSTPTRRSSASWTGRSSKTGGWPIAGGRASACSLTRRWQRAVDRQDSARPAVQPRRSPPRQPPVHRGEHRAHQWPVGATPPDCRSAIRSRLANWSSPGRFRSRASPASSAAPATRSRPSRTRRPATQAVGGGNRVDRQDGTCVTGVRSLVLGLRSWMRPRPKPEDPRPWRTKP